MCILKALYLLYLLFIIFQFCFYCQNFYSCACNQTWSQNRCTFLFWDLKWRACLLTEKPSVNILNYKASNTFSDI